MSSTVYEGQLSDYGSRSSELKPSLDPLIKNEIERNVVEIKVEAFMRAFLYPSARLDAPDPAMERDIDIAMACREMLKEGVSNDDALIPILSDASCPKYSGKAFTLLDATREENLYTPFRKLFTFINAFYRLSLATQSVPSDIDAAWPAAVDPNPQIPEDQTSLKGLLRRDFFDTHRAKLKFSSRFMGEVADLEPDLVLMLHHNKDPDKKQPSVYWKDVKVPIEVKTTFKSEGEIIPQVARYARAILMEQFDRKFAITVSLSATQCRLFHWDSVGCHATEPIYIHKDPIVFIHCIARLAMMTPAEFGYDEHFSNAGRVLSDQDITTTLTVHKSPIRKYLDREPSSEEMPPGTATSMLLELDTENFLFESRGMLFHRYTRVWRGKEILDMKKWWTGPTRVVKQNWAEDTRPCEGYFYMLTNEIPMICSLVLMEDCDRTWAYHSRVAERDVIGYLKATEKKPHRGASTPSEGNLLDLGPNPLHVANAPERRSHTPSNVSSDQVQSLERVLLRFVFEEEYRPLSKASNPSEILNATVHWIEGLIALDRLGIVHRDISYSNLMLPATDQGSSPGEKAKIIDLGLAHWKDPQGGDGPPFRSLGATGDLQTPIDGQNSLPEDSSTPNPRAARHHHHITGTLPFIALDLIRQLQGTFNTGFIKHALHHDVESIFWVLVYFCLLRAQDSGKELLTDALDQLTSPKIGIVASTKSDIIHGRTIITNFVGPFYELRDFLQAFADYYHTCSLDNQPIDVLKALEIAIEHRDKLAQDGKKDPPPPTVQQPSPTVQPPPPTVQQPPTMTPPRPTATVDSPKRKLSRLADFSDPGQGKEEELEEEVGTARKKTKLP